MLIKGKQFWPPTDPPMHGCMHEHTCLHTSVSWEIINMSKWLESAYIFGIMSELWHNFLEINISRDQVFRLYITLLYYTICKGFCNDNYGPKQHRLK